MSSLYLVVIIVFVISLGALTGAIVYYKLKSQLIPKEKTGLIEKKKYYLKVAGGIAIGSMLLVGAVFLGTRINTDKDQQPVSETRETDVKATLDTPPKEIETQPIQEYEEIPLIEVKDKPYSLASLIPERENGITVFRPDTTLYTFCFIGKLTPAMKTNLEEEYKYAYDYFAAITLRDIVLGNSPYSLYEWIEKTYGPMPEEESLSLAKENNYVQTWLLTMQLEYMAGNYQLKNFDYEKELAIVEAKRKKTEVNTANQEQVTPTPPLEVSNDEGFKIEDCYAAHIIYGDENYTHIVTSFFSDESSFFDKGKEFNLWIGSMIEGPTVVIYLSDGIETGKVYRMGEDTGYSITNQNAMFNAAFSYGNMFGTANLSDDTIGGIFTTPLKRAELCITKWDKENGVIEGNIILQTSIDKVYEANFKDEYLSGDHPTRDKEYLAYLKQSAGNTIENTTKATAGIEIPNASGLSPETIPCRVCSNGKETCTMCVEGTIMRWKSDSYGGEGNYVEEACKKCGGVGWYKCGVCNGDGEITVY